MSHICSVHRLNYTHLLAIRPKTEQTISLICPSCLKSSELDMCPAITTYASETDFRRIKLICLRRKITIYRYLKECLQYALKQIEKNGIEWLAEDDAKKKKKSWMTQMPIINPDDRNEP